MSEHLLINLEQLYLIYNVRDIVEPYYEFDFIPKFNTIDVDVLYDILNCLSIDHLNNLINFMYIQWSVLKNIPEIEEWTPLKRKKQILSKTFTHHKIKTKEEFNNKLGVFIDNDKVFSIYIMNQILKFLYPCKV